MSVLPVDLQAVAACQYHRLGTADGAMCLQLTRGAEEDARTCLLLALQELTVALSNDLVDLPAQVRV